jgi:DNA-binding PadR family transcriptional regulator
MTDAKRREILQQAILRVLDANHTRFGLDLDAVTLWTSNEGFPQLKDQQVERELEYLEEKKFVETARKELEPAHRVWKLTAAGRDFLSQLE